MQPVAPRLRPRQVLRRPRPGRPGAAGAARRGARRLAAANAWRWSARRAPARAPCCARSTATTAPTRARSACATATTGSSWCAPSRATVLDVRRRTLGFVSQFLRVIPRVATLDVVAEPLVRLRHGRRRGAPARRVPARACWASRPAVVAAAGHLLGRRAAARQHRALADRRLSDPAARRADRLARSPPTATAWSS